MHGECIGKMVFGNMVGWGGGMGRWEVHNDINVSVRVSSSLTGMH